MADELRRHLSDALAANAGVSLSTDELTAVVKHLEKHDVTVASKAETKSKEKK